MASWGNAKPAETGDICRINLSKDIQNGGEITVRIIGNYIARHVYWLQLNDGNKRTVECLGFNRETEAFDNEANDPLNGKFGHDGKELKPQFAYVIQCIDRADGKIKIIELKKTVFNELVAWAQHKDYGDFTNDETGYDITIKKNKTGPLPINVEYKTIPGRSNSPLTKEEKALKRYDLEKLYPHPSLDEQIGFLRENTDLLDDMSDAPVNGTIGEGDDVPNDLDIGGNR